MKQFVVIALLATRLAQSAHAQSFLDRVRDNKSGGGTVTVTQSPEIDELVNNAKLIRTQPAKTTTATTDKPEQAENKAVTKREYEHKPVTGNTGTGHTPSTKYEADTEAPTIDTSKKVMRHARKVTGYRVQAYSGGNSRADRQKAENIGNSIKMRFPDLPIYVHFYSPRWICRVGNFRTYQEANEVLKIIKNMGYSQACIVKGKITVAY